MSAQRFDEEVASGEASDALYRAYCVFVRRRAETVHTFGRFAGTWKALTETERADARDQYLSITVGGTFTSDDSCHK